MLWVGVPVGLLAAALLQANNLRDIATDTESGKKTLAVRLGRRRAGMFYCFTLLGAALGIGIVSSYRPWSILALLAFPVAIVPVRLALGDEQGRALLPMLGTTARLQILTGALLDDRTAPVRRPESGASGGARADGVQPVTHDPAGLLGLGQMDGMASAGDQRRDAVGDEPRQPQCVRAEAGVVGSRQSQDGTGEGSEAIPQRFLRARAGQAQAGSKAGRAVAQSLGALCRAAQTPTDRTSARAARRR